LRFRHLESLEALRADALELGRFRLNGKEDDLDLTKTAFMAGGREKKNLTRSRLDRFTTERGSNTAAHATLSIIHKYASIQN
jgi:hypothetical protein